MSQSTRLFESPQGDSFVCHSESRAPYAVCVPTLNASAKWEVFSDALKKQNIKPTTIIIVDSASEDDTAIKAKQDNFQVVQIARRDFRHGGTRQLAAELAGNSNILLYLTQDAILSECNAVSKLLQAFEDPSVGAAYGRQLPRKGANPIESHARLFNYPAVSHQVALDSARGRGFKAVFFSNSFAAYRRSALESVGGFPREVNFGEDTIVAAKLLQKGWRIAYVAEAAVHHSHHYSFGQEFRRYVSVGQLHATQPWLLREFGGTSGEGLRFVKSEAVYLARIAPWLIPSATIRTIFKYAGYRYGYARYRTKQ